MTVRERVKAIQRELMNGVASPATARESLMTLTALLGNVNEELREADLAYKNVLLGALKGAGKANRARMEAECTPQFARFREARDTQELVKQLMISCRAYLRSVDEEMRLGSHQ